MANRQLDHLIEHFEAKSADKYQLAAKMKRAGTPGWDVVQAGGETYENVVKYIQDTFYTEGGP